MVINKRAIRDFIKLFSAIFFSWLYIPHITLFCFRATLRSVIKKDLDRRINKVEIKMPKIMMFLYYIHNDRYFRNLFYHRVGPIWELLIGWWRPGDKYFILSKTMKIGPGAYLAHPFSSDLNAASIGKNFSCRNNTTIGNKYDGDNINRAIIGDNVTLGVNVTIIGPVHIGNNVIIGAGSVVVKDIPDNCIAVGNPCKPIRFIKQ